MFCFRRVAKKWFAFRYYSNNNRKRNCASSCKGQLRTRWFRSVCSASENRLKFCFFACPSTARRNSKFANRPHVMQLGQTSTSELLPAAETSQENVQGVAEVRNISHLLREPHARQCLRHRVKHLNQTTRTKSAYTSTTSFNKNPPNYCQGLSMFPVPDNKNVRNYCPLPSVENSQHISYHARRQIDKPRTTTKQSASSPMDHVRAMR